MIDKAYAEQLAETIVSKVLASVEMTIRNLILSFDEGRSIILAEVNSKLWDKLMTDCKAYEPGKPLLGYEKALACLRRKGVSLNQLSLKMMKATVSLNSLRFILRKEGSGFSAEPLGQEYHNRLPMRWVALSGEDFADFMFEFDELAGPVAKIVDRHLHQYRIKSVQYQILCQTVDQFGERFLKPRGICWVVGTDFSEDIIPVSFDDDKHISLHEQIPFEHLEEVFKDIPDRMEKQPISRVIKRSGFRIQDLGNIIIPVGNINEFEL